VVLYSVSTIYLSCDIRLRCYAAEAALAVSGYARGLAEGSFRGGIEYETTLV
jgi:hypothetical protein